MGTAASTADTRLDVNELATWTIAEVAHVRAFYAREALPFAMGEEEFVALFSGAGLSSKNVYGRISTVTTLPHDLWHVCSSEGHGGGSSDDDEHHHDDDDAASQTHSELAGFAGAGAAAARAAAAKEHGLPPPPEHCAVNALDLFAGLAVYARGDPDAKLELLFDLADADGAGAITLDEVVLLLRAAHGGVAKLLQRHDLLSADESRAEQLATACFRRTGVALGSSIQKPRFVKWGVAALAAALVGSAEDGDGLEAAAGRAAEQPLTLEGVVAFLAPPAAFVGGGGGGGGKREGCGGASSRAGAAAADEIESEQ